MSDPPYKPGSVLMALAGSMSVVHPSMPTTWDAVAARPRLWSHRSAHQLVPPRHGHVGKFIVAISDGRGY